jgi:serine/threonine protein kinase
MRFLIVDPSGEFRSTLAGMLRARWPLAFTDEWDPRAHGSPRAALARERYAAVLMAAQADSGQDWVAELLRDPAAPPVVMFRQDAAESLVRSVEGALRAQEARRAEVPGTQVFQRSAQTEARKVDTPVDRDERAIPGYRSLRKIGEGGMAQVYLAEREQDGLQLVLKVLDPRLRSDQTFFKRFVQEYRLVAGLHNEYVAHIYDQGFAGEHPYIAMEYLSGGTLATRIHEGVSSIAALRITSQIARALDAIHAHGIIHRDLKPQNILFRDNGRPVIVDFGLAKNLGAKTTLTRHGQVIATPRYMSPEQCLGKPADHRSDLYSLGVIFYEMLSGQKLYGAEGPAGLVYQHVHGPIPRLPVRLAGYQGIVDRLLAKAPEERFQSARELFAMIAV